MSNTIRLTIANEAEVVAALHAAGKGAEAVLKSAVMAGASIVKDAALTNLGRGGIDMEIRESSPTNATAAIGPTEAKWHYRFLETGTRPHIIKPSKRKALLVNGGVYAVVHHPGFKARPFLKPAAEDNAGRVEDAAGKVLRRGVERVG